jgi:hypothetical protein
MVGAFDTDPLYKRYNIEIDSTFSNVDNMPKDTYELDEIDQHSSDTGCLLANNTHCYAMKTNTWKCLQVKTTSPLALYTMNMLKSYRF